MPTIFASSTQYGNLSARKIDLDNSFYSITSNELLLVPTPLCVYGKNSHQKKNHSYTCTSVYIFKTSVGSNLKMLILEPSKPPVCSRKPNLAKCIRTTKKPNRSEPQTNLIGRQKRWSLNFFPSKSNLKLTEPNLGPNPGLTKHNTIQNHLPNGKTRHVCLIV